MSKMHIIHVKADK